MGATARGSVHPSGARMNTQVYTMLRGGPAQRLCVLVACMMAGSARAADDPAALLPSSRFGFYLHVFSQPAAVIYQVRAEADRATHGGHVL